MANFPLALAIEPRLLPYARENGFHMDHKVTAQTFCRAYKTMLTSGISIATSFSARCSRNQLSRLRVVRMKLCVMYKSYAGLIPSEFQPI